jgi:ribosome-associated heat shock protein Hsp15
MERHRIDMWLKLVCLFKHRADATEVCKGGLVKVNGSRVKPSAALKEGDAVEFYQGERFRRVIVQQLPETNVSKEAARAMYIDESPVQQKPDVVTQIFRERGAGRPTKKERREIERWRK